LEYFKLEFYSCFKNWNMKEQRVEHTAQYILGDPILQ
jgi:hypothetical protein